MTTSFWFFARGATIASGLLLTTSCAVFPFFERNKTDDEAVVEARATAWEAELASLEPGEALDAAIDELNNEIRRVDGKMLSRLSLLRADAVFDLTVASWAVDVDDLERSDALASAAGRLTGVDAADPAFLALVAEFVAADMVRAGESQQRVDRVRVLLQPDSTPSGGEGVWLQWGEEDAWIGPRARLLALRRAMNEFNAWSRRGTGDGGESMVRECGFLCAANSDSRDLVTLANGAGYRCDNADGEPAFDDEVNASYIPAPGWAPWELMRRCGIDHFGLPVGAQTPLLLNEANYLDAVVARNLASLVGAIEADVEGGVRASNLATAFVERSRDRMLLMAVPQVVTPNAFTYNIRLDIPHAFEELDGDAARALVREPALRTVTVQSDGIFVALRPHLRFIEVEPGAYALGYAESEVGLHLPGIEALAFDEPGAIPNDALVDDRVPALADAMVMVEQALAAFEWVAPEERAAADAPGVAISMFVDGSTYVSTFVPIALSLMDAGYGPVVFHSYNERIERLSAVPLEIEAEAPAGAHLLMVREDGFVLQFSGSTEIADQTTISRVVPGALAQLYAAVAAALDDGRMDAEHPLAIRIDDGSVDFGILVHLLSAVSYRRDVADIVTDGDLLASTLELAEGLPQRLVPAGIVVVP